MKILMNYLATLIPLLVMDAIWILLIARNFYATKMAGIFQETAKISPVLVFYPLYAVAVLFLVVMPALENQSWTEALWRGALLGLASYAAYDLTNHATLKNWPISMTVVDILWGVFVTAATAAIAYFLINR